MSDLLEDFFNCAGSAGYIFKLVFVTCAALWGLICLNDVAWVGMFQHFLKYLAGQWNKSRTMRTLSHRSRTRRSAKRAWKTKGELVLRCPKQILLKHLNFNVCGVFPFSNSQLVGTTSAPGMLVRKTQSPWPVHCSKRRSKLASIVHTQISQTERTQSDF